MIGNRLKTLVPLVECVGCQSLCLLFDREHIPRFRFLKGFVMKPPIADSVEEKSSPAGSSLSGARWKTMLAERVCPWTTCLIGCLIYPTNQLLGDLSVFPL